MESMNSSQCYNKNPTCAHEQDFEIKIALCFYTFQGQGPSHYCWDGWIRRQTHCMTHTESQPDVNETALSQSSRVGGTCKHINLLIAVNGQTVTIMSTTTDLHQARKKYHNYNDMVLIFSYFSSPPQVWLVKSRSTMILTDADYDWLSAECVHVCIYCLFVLWCSLNNASQRSYWSVKSSLFDAAGGRGGTCICALKKACPCFIKLILKLYHM